MFEKKDDFLKLDNLRDNYFSFLNNCQLDDSNFSFTINGEYSSFSRCFAIFGYNLINEIKFINNNRKIFIEKIIKDLNDFLIKRQKITNNVYEDKPFLQLLTFSLSALKILNYTNEKPFEKITNQILNQNLIEILNKKGFKKGRSQSGNFAMFYGILLDYSINYLNNSKNLFFLDEWCKEHLNNINQFGFWGNFSDMTYLQFQNGFHQYILLDYLNKNKFDKNQMAENIIKLIDIRGQFAPYPGGGGCYDYDAVYLITRADKKYIKKNEKIIKKIFYSIIELQNENGGFAESLYVRPRNIKNFINFLKHIYLSPNSSVRLEKIRYFISLYRSKHNKIHNHWTIKGYKWEEPNLWDSWFRVMSIANIDNSLKISNLKWNSINFPGIGNTL